MVSKEFWCLRACHSQVLRRFAFFLKEEDLVIVLDYYSYPESPTLPEPVPDLLLFEVVLPNILASRGLVLPVVAECSRLIDLDCWKALLVLLTVPAI